MQKSIVIGSKRKSEIFEHLLISFPDMQLVGYIDPDDAHNFSMLGEFIMALDFGKKADVFFIDRSVNNLPYNFIANLVKLGKHLFFDGYVNWESGSWSEIAKYASESGSIIHFGHTLYNKPLFTSAIHLVKRPRLIKIEKYCLAPKSGEFSMWLFNHLFQEIDLVLRVMNNPIRSIHARPMFLFGTQTDLLNIQIEFANDAVAVVNLGRAIEPNTHNFQIYQQDKLFSIDFQQNQLFEFRAANNLQQLTLAEELDLESPDDSLHSNLVKIERTIMLFDVWKMELRNFIENIEKNLTPMSHIDHVQNTAEVCEQIIEKIQRKYQEV